MNNKLKKICSLFLISIIAFTLGYTKDSSLIAKENGFTEEFKGEGTLEGFSFNYPSTWKEGEVASDGNAVIDVDDSTLIKIMGIKDINPAQVDEFFDYNIANIKSGHEVYHENLSIKINSYKTNYYKSVDDKVDKMCIAMYQISKDDDIYIIILFTSVEEDEKYKDVVDEFKNVIKTIKIE